MKSGKTFSSTSLHKQANNITQQKYDKSRAIKCYIFVKFRIFSRDYRFVTYINSATVGNSSPSARSVVRNTLEGREKNHDYEQDNHHISHDKAHFHFSSVSRLQWILSKYSQAAIIVNVFFVWEKCERRDCFGRYWGGKISFISFKYDIQLNLKSDRNCKLSQNLIWIMSELSRWGLIST